MKDKTSLKDSSTTAKRPNAAASLLRMILATALALSLLLIASPAQAEENAGQEQAEDVAEQTQAEEAVEQRSALSASQSYEPQDVVDSGECGASGDNLTWSLDGNTLTISGTGAMADYSDSEDSAPWQDYSGSIQAVTIGSGVTSIGNEAFSYCTSLTSVTISDSVTSIGGNAFEGCSALTSIAIPTSVISIGGAAFSYCSSLTSITIPTSVTSIGISAFFYCSSLAAVDIPDSVTSIGGYAFSYCTSLTSIIIPTSVTSIGYCAFSICEGPIYCEAPAKPDGWNNGWASGYAGDIIWGWGAPPADIQAPALSGGTATRTSAAAATVTFTSSEAGSYYRAVVTKGAKAPAINTTGAGSALKAGSQSLTVGGLVSTKAYDIYLIGKDAAGNVSTTLKVSVSAWKAGFTGWKKTGSHWYYYKAGTKQKNTALSIQGKIYSFSATGAMITGWAKIKGVKRYHDSEGIAVKGWKQIGKNWYYFKTKGAGMVTGAQKISGAWYVFAGGNSGRMLTGWQKVGKSWYYLRGGSDGRAYRGWVQSGSNWYYFNPKTAKMATGWQKISGRYYYLSGANDGHMVTGTKTIKGVKYRFNASGALVAPKAPKK